MRPSWGCFVDCLVSILCWSKPPHHVKVNSLGDKGFRASVDQVDLGQTIASPTYNLPPIGTPMVEILRRRRIDPFLVDGHNSLFFNLMGLPLMIRHNQRLGLLESIPSRSVSHESRTLKQEELSNRLNSLPFIVVLYSLLRFVFP
jgi:hypothetical protein